MVNMLLLVIALRCFSPSKSMVADHTRLKFVWRYCSNVLYRAIITTRESATDTSLQTQQDAADFSTTFSLLPALVKWL